MSANAFYFMGTIVLLFMVGFIGYYVFRLASARKHTDDDTERRLERLMRSTVPTALPTEGPSEGAPLGGNTDDPAPPRPAYAGSPVVYERGPGLRTFTEEAVFMKRDRAGDVVFQLGDKPAMPLKFLLDARGRKVLTDLSLRATLDFGQTWAILAVEDEEGRLTVNRLL
ncbi:MAG: hypothetical protein ACYC6T_07560 [Thermoleophilia bacterium]